MGVIFVCYNIVMSSFYQCLRGGIAIDFKRRKRAFKAGKPCAICGKRKRPSEMMVAHLKPVRELSDEEAIFDTSNWEVRCIECEQKLNRIEDIKRNKEIK